MFRPDVIHSHMVHANLLSRLTRLLIPVPRLITTAHNTFEGGRLLDLGYRLTDRLTDLTTNVSEASTASFRQRGLVPSGRITTVANGLDRSVQAGSRQTRRAAQRAGPTGFTWLSVGRLNGRRTSQPVQGVPAAAGGRAASGRRWTGAVPARQELPSSQAAGAGMDIASLMAC